MRRHHVRSRAALAGLGIAALVATGAIGPVSAAEVGPDKAEVVLVFDFSASILNDEANRGRFAAALERIASRVNETSRDLIAGDATVSLVQFASSARDYPGCTGLSLLGSSAGVRKFADCLRSVAGAYRAGLSDPLTQAIGIDTNYVAAMEQAAVHLPADAERPTLILFSDGRHDVDGVPVSEVAPAKERLFGDRSPFALLPVGMGIQAAARPQLEAGLEGLRTTREMPACATGAAFDWPQVVFESPDEAGNAVGVALQNATCTFTVAPTPVPTPPQLAAVQGIQLTPLDGKIEVGWSAPSTSADPVTDYRVRCTAEGEDPVESTEGVSTEHEAVVEGLTNGKEYRCEVAAVTADAEGEWTAAAAPVTPREVPPPPAKPAVEALNGGVRISVTPDEASGTDRYHYECSPDNGTNWPAKVDAPSASDTAALVGSLTNGVPYVCRAFAENASGVSAASPLSDVVKPCGSFLECSGLPIQLVGVVGVILVGFIGLALFALLRGRNEGYVVAVVDVVHTANLGNKSKLGIRFERHGRVVDGIAADRTSNADVRIRQLRGDRFKVTDREGAHVVESGEPVVVVDSAGVRHEVVLRRFSGKAASTASARR
jgi:hypothetical protein